MQRWPNDEIASEMVFNIRINSALFNHLIIQTLVVSGFMDSICTLQMSDRLND